MNFIRKILVCFKILHNYYMAYNKRQFKNRFLKINKIVSLIKEDINQNEI